MLWFHSLERPQAREQEARLGPSEMPTAKVARVAAELTGATLEQKQIAQGAKAVHYGYGMFWGAVFGVLHERWRAPRLLQDLLFGAGLAILGEVVLLPALRLTPPAHKFPVDTHLAGLASHLVYGAAAEGSFSLLKHALA